MKNEKPQAKKIEADVAVRNMTEENGGAPWWSLCLLLGIFWLIDTILYS